MQECVHATVGPKSFSSIQSFGMRTLQADGGEFRVVIRARGPKLKRDRRKFILKQPPASSQSFCVSIVCAILVKW
jgi:hypothetical protein